MKKIELTDTEIRHITRLIDYELTVKLRNQSVISEIRLREIKKKLNK